MLIDSTSVFQGELNPGEQLIWTGQPAQGFLLRPADLFLIPFSLLWGGFAFFWEWTVIQHVATFLFVLWGIPFVLVGIYFIFGRFFVDMGQRRKTHYGLTNERAIIISGLFSRNVKSLRLGSLAEINVNLKNSGRGTITFGASNPMSSFYSGWGLPNMSRYPQAPSFELIDDAASVYQQIKRLQVEAN